MAQDSTHRNPNQVLKQWMITKMQDYILGYSKPKKDRRVIVFVTIGYSGNLSQPHPVIFVEVASQIRNDSIEVLRFIECLQEESPAATSKDPAEEFIEK